MTQQLNITGIITATSHKQSKDFTSQNPRKSVYLELDKENTKKAIDFGLQEYTSKQPNKETGEIDKFFIVKASETIKQYNVDGQVIGEINGNAMDDSNNFNTGGEKVNLAIFKGEKSNNVFYRLFALIGEVQEIESQNPFAEITDIITF